MGNTIEELLVSAREGELESQLTLVEMLATKDGLEAHYREILRWGWTEANKGNVSAMLNMAAAYKNGKNIKKDIEKSAKLYNMAAEKESAHAYNEIAKMYEDGVHYSKDLKKAWEYFREGARLGNSWCFFRLARYSETGRVEKKDVEKAARYYIFAIAQGCDSAVPYFESLKSHAQASGIKVPGNTSELLEYAEKADAETQNDIACNFDSASKIENHLEYAYRIFKLAAKQGSMYAAYNVGRAYECGRGCEKSDAKALEYYLMGADLGHKNSLYKCGIFCEQGRGVARDIQLAAKYYLLADLQGYSHARKKLSKLKSANPEAEPALPETIDELMTWGRNLGPGDQNNLGCQLSNTSHIKHHKKLALEMFTLAANQGDIYGKLNTAVYYADGSTGEYDYKTAEKLFRELLTTSLAPTAQKKLDKIYKEADSNHRIFKRYADLYQISEARKKEMRGEQTTQEPLTTKLLEKLADLEEKQTAMNEKLVKLETENLALKSEVAGLKENLFVQQAATNTQGVYHRWQAVSMSDSVLPSGSTPIQGPAQRKNTI